MAEIQILKRTGKPMPRVFMQQKIDEIIKNHPDGLDFKDFKRLLSVYQIDVQAYAPRGELKGVSYMYDSLKWPGSKLGSAYSAGLTKRGVLYTTETSAMQEVEMHSHARNSKMPAAIKTLLPVQYANKGIVSHASHKTKEFSSNIDLNPRIMLETSELSEIVLLIGSLLVSCALTLLIAVVNFMQKILALFGFSMKQAAFQPYRHVSGQSICFEPTVESQLTLPVATAELQAAEALTSC